MQPDTVLAREFANRFEWVDRARVGGARIGDQRYGPPAVVLQASVGGRQAIRNDDTSLINAAGGVRVANIVAGLAAGLTGLDGLTYRESDAPAPQAVQ